MEDWRLKDYKDRCYNLQNRLTPNKATMPKIEKEMQVIQRSHKCDELTALTILKERLEKEVAAKKRL